VKLPRLRGSITADVRVQPEVSLHRATEKVVSGYASLFKKLREQRDMTQAQLAKKAYAHEETVRVRRACPTT